jgi:hypothetical protein
LAIEDISASHPLTEDHLTLLKDGFSRLDQAERMIQKAHLAGIDVTEQKKGVTELRKQLRQIGNTYFPGKV